MGSSLGTWNADSAELLKSKLSQIVFSRQEIVEWVKILLPNRYKSAPSFLNISAQSAIKNVQFGTLERRWRRIIEK
jgi:hypothetical protein